MTEMSLSVPVELMMTPPTEGRHDTLKMRRQYSKELALAALAIKRLSDEAAELHNKAYRDKLTGLPNRAVFDEELPELFEDATRGGNPIALMMIDIDGLKMANEKMGHFKGDELIKAVSESFQGILRPEDVLGRLGGDEFYVILPNYAPLSDQSADELNENFEARFKLQVKSNFRSIIEAKGVPEGLGAGISMGIAILETGDTWESLALRADQELGIDKKHSHQMWENLGIVFEDSRIIR
jgi:diguanylate cyclase (GGDEF)-like protein